MCRLLTVAMIAASVNLCAAGDERQPTAIADLIGQLSSNDFHVRQHAAKQLGNLGLAARDAVPMLGKRLHDVYPDVRGSAAKALGQIGQPAVAELVQALQDRDAGVRTRAAQALRQAGPDAKEAVPALIAALKDKHVDVRVAAVDALAEMGAEGKEAAPRLARLFHDPSVCVREHVRVALASMGPAAVEPLCDALGEEKIEVQLDAIKTIVLFGPAAKKAVPALRHAMKDEEHRIRAAAAEALGKMEREAADAVPELLAALADKKLDVQIQVVTALVSLTAAGVPDLLPKVREADRKGKWVVPVALAQVVNKPKNDLAALVQDLRAKDPQIRIQAALQLTKRGPKAQPALPLLLKVLEDDDPQVRLIAAMVIARIEWKKTEAMGAAQRVLRETQKLLTQPWRPLADLQLQAALADPIIQMQSRLMVMLFINGKAMESLFTHCGWEVPVPPIGMLGPEAVPALVEGLNITAANRIGFC